MAKDDNITQPKVCEKEIAINRLNKEFNEEINKELTGHICTVTA